MNGSFLKTIFWTLLVTCALIMIYLEKTKTTIPPQESINMVSFIQDDLRLARKSALSRRLQKLQQLQTDTNSSYYIPNAEVSLAENSNQWVASNAFLDNYHLGNQLFLFAAIYGIARMNGITPVLRLRYNVKKVHALFQLFQGPMTHVYLPPSKTEDLGEEAYGRYDRRIELLPQNHSTNLTISGYRQSWKYFSGFQQEMRSQLAIVPELKTRCKQHLDKIIPDEFKDKNFTRVGIHVRRGDIVKEYLVKFGNNVAPPEYFTHAMDYFQKKFPKVIFIVLSNEPHWTTIHIKGKNVFYASTNDPLQDFATLTLMDHMIISVGTFGWWAAWLVNGVTVYYALPYLPNTFLYDHYTQEDFYPPDWIPMT